MTHENDAVLAKTRAFAQAILDCKEYKEFIKNGEALRKDVAAGQLLRTFQEQQLQLRSGGFTPELMDELKKTQLAINQNKAIQDLAKSQEEIVDLLRRTNNIIKGRIDMPFAFTSGGGCCG